MTEQKKGGLLAAFIAVTTLFSRGVSSPRSMIRWSHRQEDLRLNYAEATLTQFAFFIAYGIRFDSGAVRWSRVSGTDAPSCSRCSRWWRAAFSCPWQRMPTAMASCWCALHHRRVA